MRRCSPARHLVRAAIGACAVTLSCTVLGVFSACAQGTVNFNNSRTLFPFTDVMDRCVYVDQVGGTN